MDKNLYVEAVDSIKAPERAVRKMLDTVRNSEKKEKIINMKKFKRTAIAASLVLALLLGGLLGTDVFKSGSSPFVISVNAAEITDEKFTDIGEMKNISGELDFTESNEVILTECFEFGIGITGKDISRVDYIAEGGVFNYNDSSEYYDKLSSNDASKDFSIAKNPEAPNDSEPDKHITLMRLTLSSADNYLSDEIRQAIRDYADHANSKLGGSVNEGFETGSFDIATVKKTVFSAMFKRLSVKVNITDRSGNVITKTLVFTCDNVTENGTVTVGAKLE